MPLSRRRFLEASCATLSASLGVVLVGCSREEANLPPSQAVAGANGAFSLPNNSLPARGEATPFKFADGAPGLLFTTQDGQSGAVNAVCTHLGCIVQWQNDPSGKTPLGCPCHASAFTLEGEVVGGPATKPLPAFRAVQKNSDVELIPV